MKKLATLLLLLSMIITALTLSSCEIVNQIVGSNGGISKTEWEEMVSVSNYTKEYVFYAKQGAEFVETNSISGKYDGTTIYKDIKIVGQGSTPRYSVIIDGVDYLIIDRDGNGFVIEPAGEPISEEPILTSYQAGNYYPYLKHLEGSNYELTYKSENWVYHYDLTIVDGKLTKVVETVEDKEGTEKWISTYTDIGTTKIELPEYKTPEDENKYLITDEQWYEIMQSTNFTYETFDNNGSLNGIVKCNDTEVSILYPDIGPIVTYYTLIDDVCYTSIGQRDDEGNVIWVADDEHDKSDFGITLETLLDELLGELEVFDLLTYSEYTQSYFFEEDGIKIEFFFEDGKLLYANLANMLAISNVNTTDVDLPEFKLPGNSDVEYTVTEEEWQEIINSTNFTYETYESGEMYQTYYKTATEAKAISGSTGEVAYCILRDGVAYETIPSDGSTFTWQALDSTEFFDVTVANMCSILQVEDFLDRLTYNAETHSYVAEVGNQRAELRFEDGVLVYCEISVEEEMIIFRNVGTTVVDDLPEFNQ